MSKFLTLEQLRLIESQAERNNIDLIDKAADATVNFLFKHYLKDIYTHKVLVVIGSGNNACDGVATAIKLYNLNYQVIVYKILDFTHAKLEKLLDEYKRIGGQISFNLQNALDASSLIIDAIFGIGINKQLSSELVDKFTLINNSNRIVVALDTPSGLNPFTGRAYEGCIKAAQTLTFISDKVGLHTADAFDFAKHVHTANLINLDDYNIIVNNINYDFNALKTIDYKKIVRDKLNTNKAIYGSVAIFANANMLGASLLAARAALKLGAGKVVIGINIKSMPFVDNSMPELIFTDHMNLLKVLNTFNVVVIGMGLGTNYLAKQLLTKVLTHKAHFALILDADALTILAQSSKLTKLLRLRKDVVITPHPKEAAVLLGVNTVSYIQNDRFDAIVKLTAKYLANVLLKGAGTLIADNHNVFINDYANSTLSNAGQGDALCGMIASFIAQGMSTLNALRFAVYLQSQVATLLTNINGGYHGILASNIIKHSIEVLNKILYIENSNCEI